MQGEIVSASIKELNPSLMGKLLITLDEGLNLSKKLIKINYMKLAFSSLFIALLMQPALFGAEKCALMLEDDIDPEEYSEVLGKKIEFCCGSCVKAFDKATAYYIKAVPALSEKFSDAEKKELGVDKVTLLEQRFCPIYPDRIVNPESKSIEYNGKTVYFWSSSAQRRWKKDPEKYFKEAMERGHLPQFKS